MGVKQLCIKDPTINEITIHLWRIMCLAETSCTIVLRRHLGYAGERGEPPPYTDMGNTFAYKDAFELMNQTDTSNVTVTLWHVG